LLRYWIECKWYRREAHCYLNVPKFNELLLLSERTNVPSYLVFREYKRWGYIMLHDGSNIVCKYSVKILGGTPKNRVQNGDDIEPLIVLDRDDIIWCIYI